MIKVKTNPMKYKDSNGNMIDVGGVIGKEVTDLTLTKSNVPADSKTVGDKLNKLSQEKVDKSNVTLDKHIDGLIYIFVDGAPVGSGVELGTVVDGDVIGTVDENNNIILSGDIPEGTYTLKYLNEDGTYTEVGTLEVGGVVVPTYTNILTSGTYTVEMNKRWSGSAKSYTACDGMICLIVPAEDIRNKTIRFKGFTKDLLASNNKALWMYLDADKTKLNILTDTTGTGHIWTAEKLVDEGNGVYSVLCDNSAWNGTFDEAVYVSINMAVNESLAVTSLDGLIMTIDEEIEDSDISYTNFADPTSADWVTGYRLSYSGTTLTTKAVSGCDITNYIDNLQVGDIVKVEGINFTDANNRQALVKEDGTIVVVASASDLQNGSGMSAYLSGVTYDANSLQFSIVSMTELKQLRFSGMLTGTAEDVKITITRNGTVL